MFAIMLLGFWLNHRMDGMALDPAHFDNHLHYRNALCMSVFIWLGDEMKRYKDLVRRWLPWACVAYFVSLAGAHLIGRTDLVVCYTHSTNCGYFHIPFYLYFATLGSLASLWIARKISSCRWLEYFGKGSIVVYMIHFFFLKAVILILCPLVDPNNKLACAALWFAIFIIVAALCAATIWLVERKGMKWAIGK